MRIGTANVIPLSGVDFMAPKQDKNERETLIKQRGLNYSSTHYVSEGAHAALGQLELNPRQSDVYADLFDHKGEIQTPAKSQVDAAHEKLRRVLGNTSTQRLQDHRHTHLAETAIRASVLRDKLDTIDYYRGKVKYLLPKAVTTFWFAESAWAISVKFGSVPKEGPAEPVGGLGFTLSTAPAQNLAPAQNMPLAFATSWAMGEVIKRAIDWFHPHYFTGLDNHRKNIARLAEDFLNNSKVASEARAGGTAAANLVQAYGESGRDFLEGLMNEVDRSAYDYMLALSKRGRPMPPDEHLAGTGVTSSALELTYARLEEARFIHTFSGRLQDDHAIVKYWQPGAAFANLGGAKIAEDPLGQEMRHLSRVRNDNVAEGGETKLWDYTRTIDETLAYLERRTSEFSGIPKNWKQIKQSLAASKKGDAKAMFQLAKLSEQGALGIPKDLVAMTIAKQLYFPAAQQGDPEAQYRLGCLNSDEHGTGRPGLRDDSAAVKWLTLAANQDHPEAQARLGLLHAAGRTGLDDHEAAIHAQSYFENAINAGVRSPELLFTLARLYDQNRISGLTDKETEALAENWYTQAAEKGHVGAQREVGLINLKRRQYDNAAMYLRMAAGNNDTEALYYLGEMHMDKLVSLKNFTSDEAAADFFKRAADDGHASANFKYALMLIYKKAGTIDGEVDYQKAAHHFGEAARQGHVQAQCWLARLFMERLAAPENGQLPNLAAAALYEKAAAQGSTTAQLALVEMHEAGRAGIKPGPEANKKIAELLTLAADNKAANPQVMYKLASLYANRTPGLPSGEKAYALATKWYQKAASKGLTDAQYPLAKMHLAGRTGVTTKSEAIKLAAELLTRSAKDGHADAQFDLAELYITGQVTPPNTDEESALDKARQLLKQAAAQGHQKAKLEYAFMLLEHLEHSSANTDELRARALEARELLDSVGTSGVPDLQYEIAQRFVKKFFDSGAKQPKSIEYAIRFLTEASERDHTASLRTLASLYLQGHTGGLEAYTASQRALEYLKRASDRGDVESTALLAEHENRESLGPAQK